MRTKRTMLSAILSIALAVVPIAVAAQATDEELATPSHWTGTNTQLPNWIPPGAEIEFFPWGYRNTAGLTFNIEADDPRAAGEVNMVYVYDISDGEYVMGRGTGIARLVNDGGTFEGPVYVIDYPDGSEFRMSLMDGQDGYEGLALSMTDFISPGSAAGHPQGLIWEGEAPPIPDPDALPE